MTTQETIALAATIWDEAKRLKNHYRDGTAPAEHARDLAVHNTRCQVMYSKLCEQGTSGATLSPIHVVLKERANVHSAALKVSEALGDTDVNQIRVPGVLALALLNLERVVKGRTRDGSPQSLPKICAESGFADTLAKKCDELAAENKRLKDELASSERVVRRLTHLPGEP